MSIVFESLDVHNVEDYNGETLHFTDSNISDNIKGDSGDNELAANLVLQQQNKKNNEIENSLTTRELNVQSSDNNFGTEVHKRKRIHHDYRRLSSSGALTIFARKCC